MKTLTALFLLAFGALLLGANALAARAEQPPAAPADPATWPTVQVPAELDASVLPPTARAASRDQKLDSSLARLAAAGPRDRLVPTPADAALRLDGERVQVQVVAANGNAETARTAVAAAGGQVTGAYGERLQAWVPVGELETLAAAEAVAYVQQPEAIVLEEAAATAALSEGVAAANADVWHDAGLRGQGVRIAIIDGGFSGYTARLGSDLPPTVHVRNFVDFESDGQVDGTTKHGAACAEIVHDVAPEAELYLLKIATDIDLNEAVDYAISQGVDIISTSLTFINVTPGDGTGRFAPMAQKARDAGILWVTAAGNYRETHWGGTFSDPDADGFHSFAPGQEVNFFGPGSGTAFLIPAGIAIQASVRWDDWAQVQEDYTLHLVRFNGSGYDIVMSSTNGQSGLSGQRPVERLTYVTSGASAVYGVAIQQVTSSRNVYFDLLTPNRELDERVAAISLGNLADVAQVFTVAAVDAAGPYGQESYSSEGPTNGPGGVGSGGQMKPDLAAFANVSTASYGTGGFNGTSAATPHVAGAAALVLNANPGYSPAQLRSFLEERSIDQGPPARDNQFGYGRLHLGQPPRPTDYPFVGYVPLAMAAGQP